MATIHVMWALSDELVSNAVWAVVGTLLGIAGTVVYESVRSGWSRNRRHAALRKSLSRVAAAGEKLGVVTLGAGPWPLGRQLSVRDTERSFFISFPTDLLPELERRYESKGQSLDDCFVLNESVFLDGTGSPGGVAEECGIADFARLLQQHRREVALDFVHGRNGCYFNHPKFGVYGIDVTPRPTSDERRCLSIELYRTDYFTHKVMRGIYRELKARGHPITQADDQADLQRYNSFCTSLGLNAVVILTSDREGAALVLTRRSKLASETRGRKRYHVTMNEGLSMTDYDSYEGRVSFKQWLRRGLDEELNLPSALVDERVHASFDDIFLVTELFEIGIVATVEISGMTFEELCSRADRAKDKKLEVDALECVPATPKAVRAFLRTHEMVPHGRYAFARVAARQGIEVGENWWAEQRSTHGSPGMPPRPRA
ncbi:MAG TPA: hypothetical protein VEX86_06025 [Longimicrobium sp.]|nr:hypothetical protein [Longimicrobium sp.]